MGSGSRGFFEISAALAAILLDRISGFRYTWHYKLAEVAEQADAHDSKSCSLGSVGSIPTFGILHW